MKTIGLIGGMSWQSTAVYYRLLNEMCRDTLGGLHSAPLLIWSFDFSEIESLQQSGDWDTAAERLATAGRNLAAAGAEALLICTNTMHRVADRVEAATGLPLLHIADATAAAVKSAGIERPLLLGTRYTMEQDFYRGRMQQRHSIEVMVPNEDERAEVNTVIYRELCLGVIRASSRSRYLGIIENARNRGADGIILGCTEIGLLVTADDCDLPLLDSTRIHAKNALEFALQ